MSTYDSLDFRASEDDREQIEIGVFSDGDCHEVITIPRHEAREYVKALQRAIRDSVGQFWGCPECGCTDVQDQAWIEVNTDIVLDSCESYMWCPQCAAGDGETLASGELSSLELVTTLKPYADPQTEEAVA